MKKRIADFKAHEIIEAIERLGTESLCGVSEIYSNEVYDFIDCMCEHEVREIENILNADF